jgi:hypothetical protein
MDDDLRPAGFGRCGCRRAGKRRPGCALEAGAQLRATGRYQGALRSLRCRRQGKRLFGTAVEDRKVVVFDFGRGKLVKEIAGVHEPRAVLYRSDLSKP